MNKYKKEELRAKAYDQFCQLAGKEQPDGCETLALFRLAGQFSIASKDETETMLVCMRYWSRNGHGQWLIEAGTELFHGGYDPELYEEGGPLHWTRERNGRHPMACDCC